MSKILRSTLMLIKRYWHHSNGHSKSSRMRMYRSYIQQCFPYYEVKCPDLGTDGPVQLWPSVQSLMIHLIQDGRKLHRHWKVVKYLRKQSKCSLMIVFMTDDFQNLTIKFRSKWERRCFLLTCQKFGRIPSTNYNKRTLKHKSNKREQSNNRRTKRRLTNKICSMKLNRNRKLPVLRDLVQTLDDQQILEQRKILQAFLAAGR